MSGVDGAPMPGLDASRGLAFFAEPTEAGEREPSS